MAKVITVFGSTGTQGGSVARAIAKDAQYKVRAVTRNVESKKAQELKQIGCEVVRGDLDDASSVQKAVQGAYGVFLVTNYWEGMDADKEIKQGKSAVDAIAAAGVKHLVYSGLEDVIGIAGYPCAHFDSKGVVWKYIQQKGVPATNAIYSAYYENFVTPMMAPSANNLRSCGSYDVCVAMDDLPLDLIAATQAGEVIHQIFNNPSEYLGKDVGLSSDRITGKEMAEIFGRVYPDKIFRHVNDLPPPVRQLEEMANMFKFYRRPDYCSRRNFALTRVLNKNIQSFEEWLTDNKSAWGESTKL